MNYIDKMFEYEGKTAKVIGKSKIKTYRMLYDALTAMQESSEIPTHDEYLGGNELAESIYRKKYYLKDLDNSLIETRPEDVFKRLASFLASVEGGKKKQH